MADSGNVRRSAGEVRASENYGGDIDNFLCLQGKEDAFSSEKEEGRGDDGVENSYYCICLAYVCRICEDKSRAVLPFIVYVFMSSSGNGRKARLDENRPASRASRKGRSSTEEASASGGLTVGVSQRNGRDVEIMSNGAVLDKKIEGAREEASRNCHEKSIA